MIKKSIIFSLILLMFSGIVYSIGISPPSYTLDFEPEKTITKTHTIINTRDTPTTVSINITGELAPYIKLKTPELKLKGRGSGKISYTLTMPEKLPPGKNYAHINVIDNSVTYGTIGVRIGVKAWIRVIVPYPGKYATIRTEIKNINEGQPLPYRIHIKNQGLENITKSSAIITFTDEKNNVLKTKTYSDIAIESKKEDVIEDFITTEEFKSGRYMIRAIYNYGQETTAKSWFLIGSYNLTIEDFTDHIYSGEISQLDMTIQSLWNGKIDNVYATIDINGQQIKTVPVDFKAFDTKTLTAYIDGKDFTENETIDATIILHFNNKENKKNITLKVVKKEKPKKPIVENPKENDLIAILYSPTAILGIIVLILILLNINTILKKNGKKKK